MISNNISPKPVGVVGAGSFGTVVANLLAFNASVLLHARTEEEYHRLIMLQQGEDPYLSPNIVITMDLQNLPKGCDVLFIVVPSAFFRTTLQQLAPFLKTHHTLIHGTKGLDVAWPAPQTTELPVLTRSAIKTMSEVVREETCLTKIGCISGPNLAAELSQGQPAATVIASADPSVVRTGQKLLKNDLFQVYSSSDLLGTELCGVLKNIIAIGAGCLHGLNYGQNTKGLLISRGIVEMIYIGKAMGATIKPFIGLAGVGDLVATCFSSQSRNHIVGYRLARGESLSQILQDLEGTAEGIDTVRVVRSLIDHYEMRAPLTEIIYRILFEGLTVGDAIQYLMKYPLNIDVDFL